MCVYVSHLVTVKTSEQLVAASGLLYKAMGMTQSDLSHTQTRISKCRQISHAFSLPFRWLLLHLLPHDLHYSLLSLAAGKVSIGLFPKLFLIIDKQRIHISLGDMGLSEVSCSFLQFSLGSREDECREEPGDASMRAALQDGGGVKTGGCLENNTSATSEWETWEVRL